ncbi:phosphotransferase [Streptomyces aidingensis]|uniref:Phosphotransferase enzyme family protein n=1 Tax=Streptomyces aidingensis TaxID=910347 RepID=A0A1I1SM03_9ACTN|nr:phosphotransferase [Streptomyces aidingensis]SFD47487.1 Phosphotransferase enzyme family protein [Streptomyces aidingensis]
MSPGRLRTARAGPPAADLLRLLAGGPLPLPGGAAAPVTAVEERFPAARSTHRVHRLRLTLAGGRRLDAVFKRLRHQPGKDAGREVHVYRRLLADGALGAPRLYASLHDEAAGRYWLLLEDVGRRGLDRCRGRAAEAAVRWAARMHALHQGREERLRGLGCLGEHGPEFCGLLVRAARRRIAGAAPHGLLDRFDRLAAGLPRTVRALGRQPRTLVHGDLAGHNLLVQHGGSRVRPVDWEWAAIGPGAWDLGRLLAGTGPAAVRNRLLTAYREEFARHTPDAPEPGALRAALAHCAVLRGLWQLGCPSPLPRGVRLEPAALGRHLDALARMQRAAGGG